MTYNTINDAVTMAGGEGTLLANRYRIVKQLGQGGMGSVWLAEDTQLDNKPFAIKMLPSILVSNKRAYRQLKDEALVAMQLVHPNIVQIRAFEENNGNPFLVMDYVEGQTLDDYLCEECKIESVKCKVGGGICEDEVIRILKPIAGALDYAHAKGVVHRDVKPGNVMIAKDGTPYILDFGIAREIQETMTRVTGKLSSGTLLYMSPEQLMGESPKPAQDIYSFAAMAYECLKGEPPFVRGAIEDQIKNKQPALPPGGTQLVASVMAGLAKKPEDRPATCAAVLEGNNLTQRRREAESQGGRARSPSGPHGNGFSRVEHVERVDGVGGARRPAEPVGRRVPTPPQPGGSRSRATAKALLAVATLALVVAGGWWWMFGREKAGKPGVTTKAIATAATNVVQVLPVSSVPEVSSSVSPKPAPDDGARSVELGDDSQHLHVTAPDELAVAKRTSELKKISEKKPEKKSKPEMKRGELKEKAKLRTPQPTPRKLAQESKEMGADESLSDVDMKKMLEKGYRYGMRHQLATSEELRCLSLIKMAVNREWDKESFNYHEGLRNIQVKLQLGADGNVRGFTVLSESGDAGVDRTVQNALTRLTGTKINGLTEQFLKEYPELTIIMEPTKP